MTQKPTYKPLALLTLFAAACVLAALLLAPARVVHAASGPEDPPSFLETFDELEPGLAPVIARTLAADVPDAYHVSGAGGGNYRTANPAHGMQVTFTPAGPQVSGAGSAWTWGLALSGWGYNGAIQPVPPADVVADGPRLEYRRGDQTVDGTPALTEWYLNTTWGLEQGFTLAAPPPGDEGERLILELVLTGSLHPQLSDDTTLLLTDAGGQAIARYTGLYAHDANGTPLPASLSLTQRPSPSPLTPHASRITHHASRITHHASRPPYHRRPHIRHLPHHCRPLAPAGQTDRQ